MGFQSWGRNPARRSQVFAFLPAAAGGPGAPLMMTNPDEQPDASGHIPDQASPGNRSPLQPTGRQTTKTPKSHPPIAPSSAKHAKLLLERSTAVPIKRFDSADYFLSQYNDHQKAEAARVAMSARRIPLDSHLSQPGSPPHPTSARFPVLGQREPPSPNRLTVAHSCKVGASSLAPDPTTSSKLAPAAPR